MKCKIIWDLENYFFRYYYLPKGGTSHFCFPFEILTNFQYDFLNEMN